MDVKELKKHCKELNKHLEEQIDLAQGEEELLADFITKLAEVQDENSDVISKLSDELIDFYNDMAAEMFAGDDADADGDGVEDEDGSGYDPEDIPGSEGEPEEKPAKKEKAKKPGKKEKAPKEPKAKKEKAKKEPKPKKEKAPKEPKPPREKKSGKKTWLTEDHKTAGGETRKRFGKVKAFYSHHKGSGSNFGKEEQPKDDLGAVLGSGTSKINEMLLGKGATIAAIAEKLGTKEGRVKNHIYALKRSGVEFEVKDGKYKVSNIPEDYYKQA
jgi:hypothetical protein